MRIPIACALDRNLRSQCVVMLSSLSWNARPETIYEVTILYAEEALGQEDRDYISQNATHPNLHIDFLCVGEAFSKAAESEKITIPTYYRLMLGSLRPDLSRIIYLDIDVIVMQDLGELYATELGTNLVGAVKSIFNLKKLAYFNSIDVTLESYFNAGILLMNLEAIRSDDVEARFLQLAEKAFRYMDQDILNIVCKGRVHYLSPRYNIHAAICFLEDKAVHVAHYGESAVDEVIDNPVIIHYAGEKPWKSMNCLWYDLWWSTYRRTAIYEPAYAIETQFGAIKELRDHRETVNTNFWIRFTKASPIAKVGMVVGRIRKNLTGMWKKP